jgi:hypothetical protein
MKRLGIIITRESITFVLLTLLIGNYSFGQNDSSNTVYVSIGSNTSGICFGNSGKYNGLRFNLWDKELSLSKQHKRQINGINFSFGVISERTNGIQIGGLACHTNKMNGLSIAGVAQSADRINGLAGSFLIDSDTLN